MKMKQTNYAQAMKYSDRIEKKIQFITHIFCVKFVTYIHYEAAKNKMNPISLRQNPAAFVKV